MKRILMLFCILFFLVASSAWGAMRASNVTGGAFFDDTSSGVTKLNAAGNDRRMIKVFDTSGRCAIGWKGPAGTGVTYSEISPDNTAVSDSRTEADSIVGWSNVGFPTTFGSTSFGTPSVGSLHFRVISSGGYTGFGKTSTASNGALRRFQYNTKRVSGTYSAVLTDAATSIVYAIKTYSSGTDYLLSETIYANEKSSSFKFYFNTENCAGQYYCDNIYCQTVLCPGTSGCSIFNTPNYQEGVTTNNSWLKVDDGFRWDLISYYMIRQPLNPTDPRAEENPGKHEWQIIR